MENRAYWKRFFREYKGSGQRKWMILIGVALCLYGILSLAWMGFQSNLEWRLCGAGSGSKDIFVILASSPGQVREREAIRSSWGNYDATVCFFIGAEGLRNEIRRRLHIESRRYQDVVLLDQLTDTYNNLTLKTLMAFSWVHRKIQCDYVLKTDSDVYVHIPRLLERLSDAPKIQFYLGRKTSKQKKLKVGPTHKWYISKEEYAYDRFPPYMMGSGYVVSYDLVAPIAACVPIQPGCTLNRTFANCDIAPCCPFQPIYFEDVTTGGIIYNTLTRSRGLNPDCEDKLCQLVRTENIHRFYSDDQNFVNEPYKYPKACKTKEESFLLMHRIRPDQMTSFYHAELRDEKVSLCPETERDGQNLTLKSTL